MPVNDSFHIYDTTLRDGAQQEGLNLSVHDKLTIARHLDDLGVGFIEGGWPGANPKDTEFFKLAQTELKLKNATFVAFGATRRPNVKAADDVLLRAQYLIIHQEAFRHWYRKELQHQHLLQLRF